MPELLTLLTTLKKIFRKVVFPTEKKSIKLKKNIPPRIIISS